MAHVKVEKLIGKTQKVKAKIDLLISGVPVNAGDTCDVPVNDANLLKGIDRVEFVADEVEEPKKK